MNPQVRIGALAVAVALLALPPSVARAGSGLFRSAFTELAAGGATGIAGGDFDRDGAFDVVTVNGGVGGNQLTGFVGDGDGVLTRFLSVSIGSFPSGVLAADFDGDDVDDLIVALANDNAVTFLKGRADQDFFDPPTTVTAVGTAPIALASADLDGDGERDLIVANEGGDAEAGSVSVLQGNGDGSFRVIPQADPAHPGEMTDALPAELGTRAVVLGTLDDDAVLDIVALNSRGRSLSTYRGNGGGAFTPGPTVATGTNPQDVALADLHDNGTLDLVIAEANDDAVSVRSGNGDGTFGAPTEYAAGTAPSRLAIGDLDGDEVLDIAAANVRSGDVTLFFGNGAGGFGDGRTYVADAEPQAMMLRDVDADGALEPVVASQGGDGGATVAVLRNRGGGALHAVEDIAVGTRPSAIASADVTDDGRPDLLVAGADGIVRVLAARPGDGFRHAGEIDVGGSGQGLLATDLDGDARPDVVAIDDQANRVAVALADVDGGFRPVQFYAVAEDPARVTSGDFNRDGRPDLAVSAIGPPARVSVLLQQSGGRFGAARETTLADEVTPIGIAALDADCDGRDDLVVANRASNAVSVLRSNADGTVVLAQTLPEADVGQGPTAIAIADFNADGVTDFAVGNFVVPPGSFSVRVFGGRCPAGGFARIGAARGGDVIGAAVARDLTGDGVADLALVNQTANVVRVLVGNGTGGLLPASPDAVSRMPTAVAIADFDLDGRYDTATGNSDPNARNVSVLYNCARDAGCDPFHPGPPGAAALRGDGNRDGRRSAADLVAVAAEIMDGDGRQVEGIGRGTVTNTSPGADANGDGVITPQDRRAVTRRIFEGA